MRGQKSEQIGKETAPREKLKTKREFYAQDTLSLQFCKTPSVE